MPTIRTVKLSLKCQRLTYTQIVRSANVATQYTWLSTLYHRVPRGHHLSLSISVRMHMQMRPLAARDIDTLPEVIFLTGFVSEKVFLNHKQVVNRISNITKPRSIVYVIQAISIIVISC